MKVTNTKYKNLFLASVDDRAENFWIDFAVSSAIGVGFAWITYTGITTAILIYYFCRFLYYFLSEINSGRTLGKCQTQTLVVDKSGNEPSIMQHAIRSFSRFISLPSGVSDDERAIHDVLSKTFVIKDNSLKKIEIKQPLYLIFRQVIFVYFIYYFLDQPTYKTIDYIAIVAFSLGIIGGFIALFRK